MIVYFSVLSHEGWGWLPVFFFAACAVLRLARFNVTQAGESKSYFIGLPSPAAGGTLATYYWFSQTPLYNQTRIVELPWQEIMQWLMLLLAFLMISPVPYPVWPKVGFRSWQGLAGLLLLLVIVLGVSLYAKYFFFAFGVGYVAYGLARWVLFLLMERVPTGDAIDEEEAVGEADVEGAAVVAHPAPQEASVGRRKRRRRRPRPSDLPTPLANKPIEDPNE
jgi:CDP-diacylglycerol--serine O-phosphatidyltransferase